MTYGKQVSSLGNPLGVLDSDPTAVPTTEANGVYRLGELEFWALGDRVIVLEDEFKTGYECTVCNGRGKASCGECGGTGRRNTGRVEVKCSHCENGAVTCPECKGKGGLLIAPETAQRRPTTGRVVSRGPECKTVRVGQNVMYSNYTGYVTDLVAIDGRQIVLRILHETEILCGMSGHLEMKRLRSKSEIAGM